MHLSQDIKDLLLALLHDEVIPMSWGMSDIIVEYDRLSFHVRGLLFVGCVEITVLARRLYNIKLDGSNRGDFHLESIAESLDSLVEHNGCYKNLDILKERN